MEVLANERTLTELDHVRLTTLVTRHRGGRPSSPATLPIEHLLDSADVVPWAQIGSDVVTMLSRVHVKDLQTNEEREITLCYPADADASVGFVSILSPMGWSLLGQRAGTTVLWPTPSGGKLAAEIVGVLFQPEASGEFAM